MPVNKKVEADVKPVKKPVKKATKKKPSTVKRTDITKAKKKLFLESLEKSLGIMTLAIKLTGVSRETPYEWMIKDPEFKKAVSRIQEDTLDFVEDKLLSLIKKGNTTATIFYLKCKGKSRGYIEKPEVEINNNTQNFNISVIDKETQTLLKEYDGPKLVEVKNEDNENIQ
jgi:hypothetical protein